MLQKNKLLKNMSYADAILSANKIMIKKNKDVFIFGQGVTVFDSRRVSFLFSRLWRTYTAPRSA